jgi:hypothetical protein
MGDGRREMGFAEGEFSSIALLNTQEDFLWSLFNEVSIEFR